MRITKFSYKSSAFVMRIFLVVLTYLFLPNPSYAGLFSSCANKFLALGQTANDALESKLVVEKPGGDIVYYTKNRHGKLTGYSLRENLPDNPLMLDLIRDNKMLAKYFLLYRFLPDISWIDTRATSATGKLLGKGVSSFFGGKVEVVIVKNDTQEAVSVRFWMPALDQHEKLRAVVRQASSQVRSESGNPNFGVVMKTGGANVEGSEVPFTEIVVPMAPSADLGQNFLRNFVTTWHAPGSPLNAE